jgi:glutamyl-tRNA synthetase
MDSVLGKLMAEKPSLKECTPEVIPVVESIVRKVNELGLANQRRELKRLAPELLRKPKQKKVVAFPELSQAIEGEVITRFPPEPNGYLHIGHAKAAIIGYEYAKRYKGKFILRFDDTNPEKEGEYYQAQKEDLKWLGIEWDKEYCTSNHLEKHYQLAKKLIKEGNAYVCTCPPEKIKSNRFNKKPCRCRRNSIEENLAKWDELFYLPEGKAVLRLKGNLESPNTAMRDPTLFRLVDAPHPLQGKKFRCWPTYDFAGAVEDSLAGVTHAFRTKEYELRDEVYYYLLDKLHLRKPLLIEFSRLSLEGMPVSKRIIKALINEGKVAGWDDPRLPTLRGLRRRGIQPQAIYQFILSQGISKVESAITFDQIEAINRKLLDPITKRLYFIPNPIRLIVYGASPKEIKLKFHPQFDLGERSLKVGRVFYISEQDAGQLKEEEKIRLKGLYNIEIKKVTKKGIWGDYLGEKLLPELKKFQWVPEDHTRLEVLEPKEILVDNRYNENSLKTITGYAEKEIEKIASDEVVQFERFGFCRIEKDGKLRAFLCG